MSFYKKHIFFCTNLKASGKKCCEMGGANELRLYAKKRIKELGFHGEGGVRVSSSGCLGRCLSGPNLVIYPEGVWYKYETQEDIDEIIQQHIINNRPAERLLNIKATVPL